MFYLSFNYLSEESAVRSALRKLAEQRLQIAVLELRDKVDLKDLGEALRESRSHKVFPAQRSKNKKTKTHRELDETSDRLHRTNRSLFNVSLEPLNRLRGKLRRTQPWWKKKQMISVLLVAVENHGVDFGVLCVRWCHLTKLYTSTTVTIKKEINICINTVSSKTWETKSGSDVLGCCVELVPVWLWSRNSDRELQRLWRHPHNCKKIRIK